MNMNNQNRQTHIDLLKLCAFLCVVLLHVTAEIWWAADIHSRQWHIANAVRVTWSVPVFVMVTGRFLLEPRKHVDFRKLMAYMRRIVIAFVFWAIVYTAYRICKTIHAEGIASVNWKWEVTQLTTGNIHLWYLPMLGGLYLITPFLRRIAEDRKLSCYFIGLFLVFSTLSVYGAKIPKIGVMLTPLLDNLNFFFARGYSGYFLLGYVLSQTKLSCNRRRLLYGAGILLFLGSNGANALITMMNGSQTEAFTLPLSGNIAVVAAAVYVFFDQGLGNSFDSFADRISLLETCSFGAYLVHALILDLLYIAVPVEIAARNPLLWIPVLTVICAAVSLTIAWLLRKIPLLGKYIA